MLEFIVLGQIPGTNIQITFFGFALFALIGLCMVWYRVHDHHLVKMATQQFSQNIDALHQSQIDSHA